MATTKQSTEISILEIKTQKADFCVLGKSPIILYRMSEKALHDLLMPKGRKTAAEKASSLKHNPIEEFRASPYTYTDENADTLLCHLSTSFKKAIAGAALDIPGAKKAQIARLLWVEGERVPIYGIPKLFMSVTRSADMNKTPDVRTRCIVPQWAAVLTLSYTVPMLNSKIVSNLLAAGGVTQGVGDWRPEKGSGNFGQFEIVSADDPRFMEVVKTGKRSAQVQAMKDAVPYDAETEDLLEWFKDEIDRRGIEGVAV